MTDAAKTSQHQFPYRDAFLGFVIILLVAHVAILANADDYGYRKYMSIAVTLGLLFNHIAYQYKQPGIYGVIAKSIAWTWLCIMMLYIGTVILR